MKLTFDSAVVLCLIQIMKGNICHNSINKWRLVILKILF